MPHECDAPFHKARVYQQLTLAGVVGGQLLLKLQMQLRVGEPPDFWARVCLAPAWRALQSQWLHHQTRWGRCWRLPHEAEPVEDHCPPPAPDRYPEAPMHIQISWL